MFFASPTAKGQVVQRDFDGFTVWFDREISGSVRWAYVVSAVTGSLDRRSSSSLDSDLPRGCGKLVLARTKLLAKTQM